MLLPRSRRGDHRDAAPRAPSCDDGPAGSSGRARGGGPGDRAARGARGGRASKLHQLATAGRRARLHRRGRLAGEPGCRRGRPLERRRPFVVRAGPGRKATRRGLGRRRVLVVGLQAPRVRTARCERRRGQSAGRRRRGPSLGNAARRQSRGSRVRLSGRRGLEHLQQREAGRARRRLSVPVEGDARLPVRPRGHLRAATRALGASPADPGRRARPDGARAPLGVPRRGPRRRRGRDPRRPQLRCVLPLRSGTGTGSTPADRVGRGDEVPLRGPLGGASRCASRPSPRSSATAS